MHDQASGGAGTLRGLLPAQGHAELIITVGAGVEYVRVSRDDLDAPLLRSQQRLRKAWMGMAGAGLALVLATGAWWYEMAQRSALMAQISAVVQEASADGSGPQPKPENLREFFRRAAATEEAFKLYVGLTRNLLGEQNQKLQARLKDMGVDLARAKGLHAMEGGSSTRDPAVGVLSSILSAADQDMVVQGLDIHTLMEQLPVKPPIAGARMTSEYGLRKHPIAGGLELHRGIDLVAPGVPEIRAASGGTVVLAGSHAGYGLAVVIRSQAGFETLYGHMSRLDVKAGDVVRPGARLGLMGSTGSSTGPHLHFEVKQNGKYLNPKAVLAGASNVQ